MAEEFRTRYCWNCGLAQLQPKENVKPCEYCGSGNIHNWERLKQLAYRLTEEDKTFLHVQGIDPER